ncbi:hypothetical protein AMK21_26500 [Streptomyces sp. CB00316]|uniref:hypothetical protein n=1 Tax=unclassified Streptomyces TaxID=2593676 RepID=UPI00093E7CEE|nr:MULTISPECIES: hypothetical protein [unclassified Streptomyces]MBT2379342.1 hypothetical protein [Streptomyces sp. ISL-111]OKJ16378.1 hypothetical protein AMK21_26500 [Streptomyces sp. CB00316]
MSTKRVARRLLVLTATAATGTGALSGPAFASTNILAAGNAAYDTTMINQDRAVTAVGMTTHGSGVGSGLVQLPVNSPENRGGGGSLLFSDRALKTEVTAVVWER